VSRRTSIRPWRRSDHGEPVSERGTNLSISSFDFLENLNKSEGLFVQFFSAVLEINQVIGLGGIGSQTSGRSRTISLGRSGTSHLRAATRWTS
jgi:hypothetical protein